MAQQLGLVNATRLQALVDDDVYDECNKHIWMLIVGKDDTPLRVWARIKGELVYLHHFVTQTHHTTHSVSFVNNRTVDCRKENLIVTVGADQRFVTKRHRD